MIDERGIMGPLRDVKRHDRADHRQEHHDDHNHLSNQSMVWEVETSSMTVGFHAASSFGAPEVESKKYQS